MHTLHEHQNVYFDKSEILSNVHAKMAFVLTLIVHFLCFYTS